MKMTHKITPAYPSFTRRAITFTIDDGNIKYDSKFIEILRPHGIRGTFNLCPHSMDREDGFYREFYAGFGIANHTYRHPYAMEDSITYITVNEPRGDQPPATDLIYPHPTDRGFYWKHYPHGWRELADTETYLDCITRAQARLARIFGDGAVRGFVWPYSEQNNAEIKAHLHANFTSVRKTGDLLDTTGFSIPTDKMAWSYHCRETNLLDVMAKFAAYPDDGTLKFCAIGVHSVDFERAGKWDDLASFAATYGDRPHDFWYAPVDDIFDYATAMDRLRVTDTAVENPTDLTLYVELDGTRLTLPAHTVHPLE